VAASRIIESEEDGRLHRSSRRESAIWISGTAPAGSARGAPDVVPRSGAALIIITAQFGNAMKLPLDAN
jgi:hypothetical protein